MDSTIRAEEAAIAAAEILKKTANLPRGKALDVMRDEIFKKYKVALSADDVTIIASDVAATVIMAMQLQDLLKSPVAQITEATSTMVSVLSKMNASLVVVTEEVTAAKLEAANAKNVALAAEKAAQDAILAAKQSKAVALAFADLIGMNVEALKEKIRLIQGFGR